jgi:hypothetical protein
MTTKKFSHRLGHKQPLNLVKNITTGSTPANTATIPTSLQRNDGTTEFNTDSDKFEKWKKKTKVVLLNEKSKAWYEKHKGSVEEKRVKYWDKWMQKSTEDLATRTLNASDGT